MPSPDLVFALTGRFDRNSRALKQVRVCTQMGLRVHVLALGEVASRTTRDGNVTIEVLPKPAGGGPAFFARVHWLFRAAASRVSAALYHASDLYALPALARVATQRGSKLTYDARECYPHVAATVGRPWVRRFWQVVEGQAIRRASAVFTVSTSIADHLTNTYRISRPDVLYNVPERQNVTSEGWLRQQLEIDAGTVIILHQGQMRKHRGCTVLVDAMRDVDGAVLVFLGYGPLQAALEQQVQREDVTDRVRFLDAVSPDRLLTITASGDVGVTMLEDVCLNHRYALPNKLFEYLMAELPVLASDLPEIRKVVVPHDVGRVVDPTDRTQLVETLQRMVDDGDARTRWRAHTQRVFETFSWEAASKRLEHTLNSLLA